MFLCALCIEINLSICKTGRVQWRHHNGADAKADEKADKRVTKIYRPIYPIDEILVK